MNIIPSIFFVSKREYKNVNIDVKRGTTFSQIYKNLKLNLMKINNFTTATQRQTMQNHILKRFKTPCETTPTR